MISPMLPPLLLLLVAALHLGAAAQAATRAHLWRRCPVEEFGAHAGDGKDDTVAIRAALAACGGLLGGEITLRGPGIYDSAPMNLTSNQILRVAAGATLKAPTPATGQCMSASTPCAYPVMDSFPSYTGSRDYGTPCRLGPFIGAFRAHNVTITGGGTIDGSGKWWWDAFRHMSIERPRLVELQFVDGLNIGPINLIQSPFWNLHPVYCSNVHIHDISITADSSPNTDGIDPDSCKNGG